MEEMDVARRAGTGAGLIDPEIDIWISHYMQIAEDAVGGVSDAVPALCGRPAMSLAEYLRKHRL